MLFKNPNGMAISTVTQHGLDAHLLRRSSVDWFHFNQCAAPQVPMMLIKQTSPTPSAPWTQKTTMFRALMITYYVDNTTTRQRTAAGAAASIDFAPQALAGIVEDLDLTYDLVDGVNNPTDVPSLPYHRRRPPA